MQAQRDTKAINKPLTILGAEQKLFFTALVGCRFHELRSAIPQNLCLRPAVRCLRRNSATLYRLPHIELLHH